MSDHRGRDDAAARALADYQVWEEEVTLNGETFLLRTEEPRVGEIKQIQESLDETEGEADFQFEILDRYAEFPDSDITIDDVGMTMLEPLFEEVARIWHQADEIEAATDELPVEGNSRR